MIVHRRDAAGEHGGANGDRRLRLLDRYARDLPGVERMSIVSSRRQRAVVPATASASSRRLKRTDGDVLADPRLRVRRRRPVHARPTSRDAPHGRGDQRGHARERFFGGAAGARPDASRSTASASASSASCATSRSCASCRSPTSGCRSTTAKTDAYKRELHGRLHGACCCAQDRADARRDPRRSSRSRLDAGRAAGPEGYTTIVARRRDARSTRSRAMLVGDAQRRRHGYGAALAIVLAVAARCCSCCCRRSTWSTSTSAASWSARPEIGVRKAFGASSRDARRPVRRRERRADARRRRPSASCSRRWSLRLINAQRAHSRTPQLRHEPRGSSSTGVAAGRRLRRALGRVSRLAHVAPPSGRGAEGRRRDDPPPAQAGLEPQARERPDRGSRSSSRSWCCSRSSALGVYYVDNWRRPLGFDYRRRLGARVDMPQATSTTRRGPGGSRAGRSQQADRWRCSDLPQVEVGRARCSTPYPCEHRAAASGIDVDGRTVDFGVERGHRRLRGRARARARRGPLVRAARTTALTCEPVVINAAAARDDLFGTRTRSARTIRRIPTADRPRRDASRAGRGASSA